MQPEIHQHIRHRKTNLTQHAFPSRNPLIRFFDILVIVGGVLGPFISFPQIYKIWVEHNTAGLSVLTWAGYCILSAIWLTYGLLHRERAIIVSQVTWLIFNIVIFAGILIN